MGRGWSGYAVYTVVVVGTEMVVAGTIVVGRVVVVEDMPMEKSTT
jgi:hypothetical protein